MPERRKSPEEWAEHIAERAEADGDPVPDDGPDAADAEAGEFTPFTEEDRQAANRAFALLNDAGFITNGPYQLAADDRGRKVVTLSAYLPHTLDLEPPATREAGESDDDGSLEPLPDDGGGADGSR